MRYLSIFSGVEAATLAWEPVSGYEGSYLVSNCGDVYSIARECVLTPHRNTNGYLYVMLSLRNKKKRHYIHRLVATAFIDKKDERLIVNHINGVKTDNRVENLEWCTYSQNNRHAYVTGLKRPNKTTQLNIKSRKRVIGRSDVLGVIEFESISSAKENGFRHVSECINGHLKTCGGYVWEVTT